MEVTYKGFKGEKIVDEGKELIILAEEDTELVWIEDGKIRSQNIELLKETLAKYGISDVEIKEEKYHPGLFHYIVNI
ncbi:hypothetical protein [Methanobacterium sp.]|uniref:hypothetical protein n=1 Tax=Methanobacterium sp. TaxID=2164 RepID=UPI0031589F08